MAVTCTYLLVFAGKNGDVVLESQRTLLPPLDVPPPTVPGTPSATPTGSKKPAAPTARSAPKSGAKQPLGVRGAFSLVKEEGFSGSALDTKLWSAKEPWNNSPGFPEGDGGFCPVPMSKRLVEVSGGTLKLHAIPEPAGGNRYRPAW